MKRPRTRRVRKGGARLTERPRGGVASLGRSDTARYFRASTAAEITVIRDECRQASVVVASLPHRLRHLSAMVLQCLRHGVYGRGIGGLGSNVGPLALFQSTSDRDVTRYALRGPGATTKLRVPRPGVSWGTVAGRGEPANRCWGAMGYTDATIMCERCRVANQQIVGASCGRSSSELIRLSDGPP